MEGAGEDKEAAKKPTDKVSACGRGTNYKYLFLQIFIAGLTDAVPGSNEFADQGANPIWKVTNQNFKNNQTNKPYLVGDVYSINSKVVIAQ